ncbi:MAG: hypothetical protein Fur0046_29020 [Cyanobacteria bacterium J069]
MATQNSPLYSWLSQLAAGEPLNSADQAALEADLWCSWQRTALAPQDMTAEEWTAARIQRFRAIYPAIAPLCQSELGWDTVPLELLWGLWLPLADWLVQRQRSHCRPLIQGILGGQGTGKSTLARLLRGILEADGLRVACLSIDDLYKTWGDRQQLQQADPRLRWRGPPGTHDVDLGIQTLQDLRQGKTPVLLPRFDKSLHQGGGDRISPEPILGADIVLFEGWFVGLRPIDPAAFDHAPPPILSEGDRTFARDCNTRLADYLPLWELLDGLIVLRPSDYRLSQQWRKQAEQRMTATGRPGMSDPEIDQFVEYFWRSLHPALFYPPLLQDAERVDWVVEILPDRQVGQVRKGGKGE